MVDKQDAIAGVTPEDFARWKAEWDGSPQLREEFVGEFVLFAAFKKAEKQGLTKIYAPGRPGR